MKLETKFDVGDKVYSIITATPYEEQRCSMCAGIGSIPYMQGHVTCPLCHGSKVELKVSGNPVYIVSDKFTIKEIRIRIEDNQIFEDYLTDNDLYYSSANTFSSKEEAQKECDKRSGKSE